MKYLHLVEFGMKTARQISKHFKSDIWTYGFIQDGRKSLSHVCPGILVHKKVKDKDENEQMVG